MVPMFQVAVRDEEGNRHLFRLQDAEVLSYMEVVRTVLREFPRPQAILVNMPVGVDH